MSEQAFGRPEKQAMICLLTVETRLTFQGWGWGESPARPPGWEIITENKIKTR